MEQAERDILIGCGATRRAVMGAARRCQERYRLPVSDRADLAQLGLMRVIQYIDRFDPDRMHFSLWATLMTRDAVLNHLRAEGCRRQRGNADRHLWRSLHPTHVVRPDVAAQEHEELSRVPQYRVIADVGSARPAVRARACKRCGGMFDPNCNRQVVCGKACRAEAERERKAAYDRERRLSLALAN